MGGGITAPGKARQDKGGWIPPRGVARGPGSPGRYYVALQDEPWGGAKGREQGGGGRGDGTYSVVGGRGACGLRVARGCAAARRARKQTAPLPGGQAVAQASVPVCPGEVSQGPVGRQYGLVSRK